jgi:membrane protein required for colicin V production
MMILSAFNWIDFLILSVILISLIIGFIRGFIRETISLATWVLAVWIGIAFSPLLSPYLASFVTSKPFRLALIFIVLLIAVVLVGNLISRALVKIVSKTGLSGVNHLLGVGFGAIRGLLIVVVALLFIEVLFSPYGNTAWKEAQILPHLKVGTDWLRGAFPELVQKVDDTVGQPLETSN